MWTKLLVDAEEQRNCVSFDAPRYLTTVHQPTPINQTTTTTSNSTSMITTIATTVGPWDNDVTSANDDANNQTDVVTECTILRTTKHFPQVPINSLFFLLLFIWLFRTFKRFNPRRKRDLNSVAQVQGTVALSAPSSLGVRTPLWALCCTTPLLHHSLFSTKYLHLVFYMMSLSSFSIL